MDIEDLRRLTPFEGLDDRQLTELVTDGEEVPVVPGVVAFTEGEPADDWWVLLSGGLDLVRHVGTEEVLVGRMDVPGRWAGGFRAWDAHGSYLATGRGTEAGAMLRLSAAVLRERVDAWLPLAGHLIGGAYGTARSIEATARQRDALVTLGTLAAGLAHELNNPAAAATRAVSELERTAATVMSSLARLAGAGISARQFLDLDGLRGDLVPPGSIDALALADREDELGSWLERHGVPGAWTLAAALTGAGATPDWCDRVAALLPAAALEPGLQWVASAVTAQQLQAQVAEATGRVSELVGAVRSYTQMDRAARQPTVVTEGLESTLTILGHKLHAGIEVVRDYQPDLPRLEAWPGELNQVWTNLLDNAIDAVAGSGTITVSTHADDDAVVVEVADTGPGMTPQVAARAFDAFFTTKDAGDGTGLGLDIARRIVVDRHGGTIDLTRRGAETVLRVSLPR